MPSLPPGEVIGGSAPVGAAADLGPARRVTVGPVDLAYRLLGDSGSPPLLLLAGQASAMNVWGFRLPTLLARRFRVFVVDHRGVGWSTDPAEEPLTIQQMAEDVAGLLGVLDVPPTHVVGWSTGGEVALALGVRHPGLVRTLTVCGATAGGPTAVAAAPDIDRLITATDDESAQILLTRCLFPPTAGAAVSDFVEEYLSVPAPEVESTALERQVEAERLYASSTEVYDALPDLIAPVLVAQGGRDPLVPLDNARIIAARAPRSQLEVFADSAHALMFQERDRFVRLVTALATGG